MAVPVTINNKTINMEIDTGTYFTVMSEKFINNMFTDTRISYTSTRLLGYENNKMELRGKLRNLQVKLLNCLLLKGDKASIIERQWLAAFG